MTFDLEVMIKRFLDDALTLQNDPTLTTGTVLNHILQTYRDVRINGAEIDSDSDMLLFQWGKTIPFVAEEPIDLRNLSPDNICYEESEQKYIDFTRQIFVTNSDEDAEFDDLAVQLSITLTYGSAIGDERSSNLWIEEPESIENEISNFRNNAFTQQFFNMRPLNLIAFVDRCG